MKKILSSVLVASMLLGVGVSTAFGLGGPSKAKLDWQIQGKLGAVKINPYGTTPLTAVIMNGGYEIKNAKVEIVPKEDGQKISFEVEDDKLKPYCKIPI